MPSLVAHPVEALGIDQPMKALGGPPKLKNQPDILDIRQSVVDFDLKEEIHSLLRPDEGPKRLPTLLLYDEKGLQLFEKITYLEEYYLTNSEIQLLRRSTKAIADSIPSGSMFIELGSGNLRKILILLQALDDAGKDIDYYALDLSKEELQRTLSQLPAFRHIRCRGLLGTYDDGREWLKKPDIASRRKCVASMGSSIGNFHRDEAAAFLKDFADVLQSKDTLLIGLDSCTNPSRVYHAYNDKDGVTHQFVLNGLEHANKVLERDEFELGNWQVIGEYVYDEDGGRHQAFYAPKHDTTVLGQHIRAQERVQIEQSLKYSAEGCQKLWASAELTEIDRWMTDDDYGLHLLCKPTMSLGLKPSEYAQSAVPSLKDWEKLWTYWDTVTRGMLPTDELLDKPIKLRNACIFYLGHIPTFLDIQLSKTTGQPPTDPALYRDIFERGIDPDVDNPEKCHTHSEIPDEWPPLEELVAYQGRVRARLRAIYSGGLENIPRDVGRGVWVGFEHEIMHMETLLYMMLQSDKTLPPPIAPQPDFEALAHEAHNARVTNQWFEIPGQRIKIGLDDPEDDLASTGPFGWDNEKPSREIEVHGFQAKARPITNEEYAQYLHDTKANRLPASWAEEGAASQTGNSASGTSSTNGGHHLNGYTNGERGVPHSFLKGKMVKTVYGLVPLKLALDWPVSASYDELQGCAAWMGGRIPTFEEAQSIYSHVDHLKCDQAERQLGKTVPAVNAHLVNDGVQETPPPPRPSAVDKEGSFSPELFVDLSGANVGFQHWHPVAVTGHGDHLAGRAEMGGVWEWTSSPLRRHEGFQPMELYPAYTADFFDDKHNVILGGSWATHPLIAGRKSFVNWYQRNYPFAWAGARLVRDL